MIWMIMLMRMRINLLMKLNKKLLEEEMVVEEFIFILVFFIEIRCNRFNSNSLQDFSRLKIKLKIYKCEKKEKEQN